MEKLILSTPSASIKSEFIPPLIHISCVITEAKEKDFYVTTTAFSLSPTSGVSLIFLQSNPTVSTCTLTVYR